MKQFIAAQFSAYGIAEAVSHSVSRPAEDPCMSRTFVTGRAGENFHVTVCWYVWEEHPELSSMDEAALVKSPDAEIQIFSETDAADRLAEYTRRLLSYGNDGCSDYTVFRCVLAGEEEDARAALVLYCEGDAVIDSLADEELWALDVTMFDNNEGYDREEFSRFRGI